MSLESPTQPLSVSEGDEELWRWLCELAQKEMLVKSLDLCSTQVSDAGVQALAASTAVAPLQILRLNNTQVSDAGVQALAASTSLTQLRSLHLGNTQVSDAGVQALAASTSLTQLRSLHLDNTQVSDDGVQALAASTSLSQLEILNLQGTQVSDVGVRALAASLSLTQLKGLWLFGRQVGDPGVQALAASTSLTQMQRLNIESTQVSDAGVKALAASTSLTQLQYLNLDSTQVSDAGVKALAASTSLTQLQHLHLGRTQVSDSGVQALAASASLTQMQSLCLGCTQVSDVGVRALAASSCLSQLQSLNLYYTQVTDTGLKALAASTSLTQLQTLNVSATKVTVVQIMSTRNAQVILRYIRESVRGDPLFEVKVPILGIGGNGKSLLRGRLTPKNANEPADKTTNPATHAFVKSHFSIEVPCAGLTHECMVRLFDFGGQPEMHGTHRFFLSDQRNVYIILVNSRLDRRQNRLDYWLRMVKHHGAGAPAIVVVSHCDGQPGADDPMRSSSSLVPVLETLNATQLTKMYGINIQVVDGYSNIDGNNLKRVKEALCRAVAELTYVFEARYPPGFFQVLKWLDGNPSSIFADHATFESVLRVNHHFRKACEAVGQADAGQQNLWLILLRDLGYLHYVGDRPEVKRNADHGLSELIFHPEWVKLPVYDIVRDSEAWSTHGIALRSRLESLLRQRNVNSVNERRWILALMCACELIFKVSGGNPDNECYFIPDQVGLRPKNASLQWVQTSKKKLRWEFPFLPDHLLLQLFGHWFDRHPEDHTYYRDEVILRSDDSTCRVRLCADFNLHTVELEFDAERERDWLRLHAKLESAVESILDPEKLQRRGGQRLWKEFDEDRTSAVEVNEEELVGVAYTFFELHGRPRNVDEINTWINAVNLREVYFQTEALKGFSQRIAYRACFLYALSQQVKNEAQAIEFPLEPAKPIMARVLNWLNDAPQLKKLLLGQSNVQTYDSTGNLAANYRHALSSLGHELLARIHVPPRTTDKGRGRTRRPMQDTSVDDDP